MQANDNVIPKARSLFRFDNSSVITKGEVVLTTFAEGVIKDTMFQVIDGDMAYNMILGRPWIHDIDVVPSTLHQVIKFPLQWEIRQIRRDQQASKNINSVVTDVSSRLDVIQEPEENENIKTTAEELKVIVLFIHCPDRKVYIGVNLSPEMKGYNQINMDPLDEEKISFITDMGTFCYEIIPFGLKNAGATYQRLVTKIFQEHLGKTMEVYIDDMLVKSAQAGDHFQHLGIEMNPAQIKAFEEIPDVLTSIGIVLIPPSGEVIRQAVKCYPITNNEAEYEAVIVGLKLA
ncbi:uncharacterized protein LOC142173585 [Nicotiana tabacum]|uniref:Uncharacterized protein LOC142173585 n=1 Tax=Nicotiana tabacum TaxID=4097 RepID=A0AC58TDJ6_TOBAC